MGRRPSAASRNIRLQHIGRFKPIDEGDSQLRVNTWLFNASGDFHTWSPYIFTPIPHLRSEMERLATISPPLVTTGAPDTPRVSIWSSASSVDMSGLTATSGG